MNKKVALNIIESILDKTKILTKLRLSNINLNDENIINKLLEVVEDQQENLKSLNLSYASLSPKLLCMISGVLWKQPQVFKNIDLSYNTLNMVHNEFENTQLQSRQFITNMCKFFNRTDLLNHLDISGMNFNTTGLLMLCETLAMCPSLMSIHLNDNNINENKQLHLEILQIFDIEPFIDEEVTDNDNIKEFIEAEKVKHVEEKPQPNSLEEILKSKLLASLSAKITEQIDEFTKQNKLKLEIQNLNQLQKEKTGIQMLKNIEERNTKILKIITETENEKQIFIKHGKNTLKERNQIMNKTNYKNHLFKYKKAKLINDNKLDQQTMLKNGLGRSNDSNLDQFVLSRVINNPELIWNQDPQFDSIYKKRFFEVDASKRWKLSLKNECYMCDGHKYTVIAFKQGIYTKANDESLSEVLDEQTLKELENNYKYNFQRDETYTPIISGSVVNDNAHKIPMKKMNFERKLRMIKVEMFAALLISQCGNFVRSLKESQQIKTGLVEYVKRNNQQELIPLDVIPQLENWMQMLIDKCLKNELTDVHVENLTNDDFENWNHNIGKKDVYIYANYLPAGEHKFLIYDPVSKRAFVKTIYVGINTKDFYPEWPAHIKIPRKKLILNVWRNCPQVTNHSKAEMCRHDINITSFDLSLIVKEKNELARVKELIRTNYDVFLINHIELLVKSGTYPKLDYQTLQFYYNIMQNEIFGQVPMKIEQMELQFIRVSRNQGSKGLSGQLDRSEFIEYMVRLAKSAYPTMAASLSVVIIIGIFLKKLPSQSSYISDRDIIRQNFSLNKTLYENKHGLNHIFKTESQFSPGFLKQNSESYIFGILDGTDFLTRPQEIHQIWVYSLEFVDNDKNQSQKYSYLTFTEFQEFIIRVALHVQSGSEISVVEKVHKILELMYFQAKILRPEEANKINEEIDISLQPIIEYEF